MEDEAKEWSPTHVVRVYRPEGGQNWFPVNAKNVCTRNKFVDGVRCELKYAFRGKDGFAHWKIDGRSVQPNQLIKLERGRNLKSRVRVNKILVDPANLRSRGHTIAREILCVDNELKLELTKCVASPDETVYLVASGLHEELSQDSMDNEPEVVIQPVSEDDISFRTFEGPSVVVVKQEPVDRNTVEEEPEDSQAGLRRSKRLRTEEPTPKPTANGRTRKNPQRKNPPRRNTRRK